MGLAGAVCCFVDAIAGFTNQSLRGLVAGLLGRGLQPGPGARAWTRMQPSRSVQALG
jgi:hypothetical protein